MRKVLVELAVQILIGLLLVVCGLYLCDVIHFGDGVQEVKESANQSAKPPDPAGNVVKPVDRESIRHHLGTALLTAGILLITVELYVKVRDIITLKAITRRESQYLEAVRDASQYAVLRTMLPHDAILDQIKRQIIKHQSLRRDYHVTVHLRWKDSTREQLIKTAKVSFNIENVTSIPLQIPIRAIREADSPDEPRPELVYLSLYSKLPWVLASRSSETIHKAKSDEKKVWREAELISAGALNFTGNEFDLYTTVILAPGQCLEVEFTIKSIEKREDRDLYLCVTPTVNYVLEIHPAEDLELSETFYHPGGKKTQCDNEQWTLRIDGGVLPYQGMEYSWIYKPPAAAQMQSDI